MDRAALGVLGAVSALVAFAPATAGPVIAAASFAELLNPIPNAVARLKADDAVRKAEPQPAETSDFDGCRPMSRAGCFRPRKPARPAPVVTSNSNTKPAPATATTPSN